MHRASIPLHPAATHESERSNILGGAEQQPSCRDPQRGGDRVSSSGQSAINFSNPMPDGCNPLSFPNGSLSLGLVTTAKRDEGGQSDESRSPLCVTLPIQTCNRASNTHGLDIDNESWREMHLNWLTDIAAQYRGREGEREPTSHFIQQRFELSGQGNLAARYLVFV